jgi:hypothetical protein
MYYNKYIKYKTKYLDLLNNLSGGTTSGNPPKLQTTGKSSPKLSSKSSDKPSGNQSPRPSDDPPNFFTTSSNEFKNYIMNKIPVPKNRFGGVQKELYYILFKNHKDYTKNCLSNNNINKNNCILRKGINNTDIWLYPLDSTGTQQAKWRQVPALTGNNIAYNSLVNGDRNIYGTITSNIRIFLSSIRSNTFKYSSCAKFTYLESSFISFRISILWICY